MNNKSDREISIETNYFLAIKSKIANRNKNKEKLAGSSLKGLNTPN